MTDGKFDVLIVGAGVAGAAVARRLSRYRLDVAVLEKEVDVSFGVSKANSGIVHAGFHDVPETLKGKLCQTGNRMFSQLHEELDFPFARHGELMVAFDEDELRTLQTYHQRGLQNHVPFMEMLGPDRVLELEPNLNPDIVGALHAPTAGVVCPYEYCFALMENAVKNGVKLFTSQKVTWIGRTDDGLRVETEAGLKFKTRFVVNAAGLFADEIAKLVGLTDFKIIPRKGEEYLLDRRVSSLVRKVVFPVPTPTSKGMLVIPTVDGPVMVGPTAENIDRRDDFSTTREGLKKVFEHAQRMVPAIRSSDAITSFVGLRPVATGDDFIIGPTKVPGFINVAGIQSPGLTASPAIAELVKDILLKEGLRLEENPAYDSRARDKFVKIRGLVEARDFAALGQVVAADPDYGKLVCRCENVTEAEIRAAVRAGHHTLDGVKFATRAGTGRCQGGFCGSRVMRIIHEETGIPIEQISKKGPGSEITPIPLLKGGRR